jgi:hypothetical protein
MHVNRTVKDYYQNGPKSAVSNNEPKPIIPYEVSFPAFRFYVATSVAVYVLLGESKVDHV